MRQWCCNLTVNKTTEVLKQVRWGGGTAKVKGLVRADLKGERKKSTRGRGRREACGENRDRR